MTKTFEEKAQQEIVQATNTYEVYRGGFEVDVPEEGLVVRSGNCIMCFPWLEFAKNWHSDEEFQKLKEELEDTRDALGIARNSRDEFEREYRKLKYEQQPLPEVPEFVAKWYEDNKNDLEFSLHKIAISIYNNTHHDELELWFCDMRNKPMETIFSMKDGYTVQKPKLFYLKHIDMSKADKELDYYLAKEDDGTLSHDMPNKGQFPWHPESRFTQEEIDSMQTGSYEQIEVEE